LTRSLKTSLATLALCLAVAACQATSPYGAGIHVGDAAPSITDRDRAFIADAVATGRDVQWQSGDVAYRLDVLRTYQEGGTTCRDYSLHGIAQEQVRVDLKSRACRAGNGTWRS
jgi:hypothetical protein